MNNEHACQKMHSVYLKAHKKPQQMFKTPSSLGHEKFSLTTMIYYSKYCQFASTESIN